MHAIFRGTTHKANRILAPVRAALLPALVLLLAACGSVQAPAPGNEEPGVAPGSASVSGAVLTEDYAISRASWNDGGTALRLAARSEPVLRAQPAAAEVQADHVPGQVLVQYRTDDRRAGDGSASARMRLMSAAGASTAGTRAAVVKAEAGEDVEALLGRLASDPTVVRASPNYYVHPTALPDDPMLPQQWGLAASGVPMAWGVLGSAGEPVVVATIDTGFDLDHEDLAGRYLPGYDFCSNLECSARDADPSNGDAANWHGTHVAGIIAAAGGNGVGVSGVANGGGVRILPVKVFNDKGYGANTAVLIDALRWAAGLPVDGAPTNTNPARIINLSLAGAFPASVLQDTLDEVRAAGALVVASTGNNGVDRVLSPAAADGVVGVGASNKSFRRSCFSNYGVGSLGPGGVDLVAPGGEADGSTVACGVTTVEGLVGPIPGHRYGSAVGTSVAAPMVSGAAALILAQDPTLDVDELEARLLGSAFFDGSYMNEAAYGAGVLRADRALGLMGPGDVIDVELAAEDADRIHAATVSLGLTGASTSYSFRGIPAGSYALSATGPGVAALFDRVSVTLAEGEERQVNLVLQSRR